MKNTYTTNVDLIDNSHTNHLEIGGNVQCWLSPSLFYQLIEHKRIRYLETLAR